MRLSGVPGEHSPEAAEPPQGAGGFAVRHVHAHRHARACIRVSSCVHPAHPHARPHEHTGTGTAPPSPPGTAPAAAEPLPSRARRHAAWGRRSALTTSGRRLRFAVVRGWPGAGRAAENVLRTKPHAGPGAGHENRQSPAGPPSTRRAAAADLRAPAETPPLPAPSGGSCARALRPVRKTAGRGGRREERVELLRALVLRGPRLPSGSGPFLSPEAAAAAGGVTVGAMAEAAVRRGTSGGNGCRGGRWWPVHPP